LATLGLNRRATPVIKRLNTNAILNTGNTVKTARNICSWDDEEHEKNFFLASALMR